MKIALAVLCISAVAANSLPGQHDCGTPVVEAFSPGEKLSYEMVYNWGFIWVNAGRVDFSVKDTLINSKKHYRFKGYGTSYEGWDWFYKVRSTYESLADDQLNTVWFMRKGQEGSNRYNHYYTVKGKQAEVSDYHHKRGLQRKTIDISACALDVMTAIYYCRTLDFQGLAVGQTIPITLYLDGAFYPSHLRYLGKETWTDERSGKSYNCIKFSPLLVEGTVFSAGEKMVVWVSDDERKVPVYVETDLVVGKGKVFLLEDKP